MARLRKRAQATLRRDFPFRDHFIEFLSEYSTCRTYWYVPKARSLSDLNVEAMGKLIEVIAEDFAALPWNIRVQDKILDIMKHQGIYEPYSSDGTLQDRTALVRIGKILMEWLGLLWIKDGASIVITDAGYDLIHSENPRSIIEGQIAKFQYPNPAFKGKYSENFAGILPHLFLLQVLQKCNNRLSISEFELFINLSSTQNDIDRITKYILLWRDLDQAEQNEIIDTICGRTKYKSSKKVRKRYLRIHQNISYQRSFFAYPSYLIIDEESSEIRGRDPQMLNSLINEQLANFKISLFENLEDWFAYYGDPKQKPSWFTFLMLAIEKAPTKKQVRSLIRKHSEHLAAEERVVIEKRQTEKMIEDFYAKCLEKLEPGLKLMKDGRQLSTPIGRIDLLCKSKGGDIVVVEIKSNEADDAVFGQILRYIGWVYRNLLESKGSVRGIIVAGMFGEKARYSRIGLLKKDYKEFLSFKKHGLLVTDV